jgi:tetratricopeptide (TPR) repeat protein
MGETLNLLFKRRDDDSVELQVRESWSGRIVTGSFVPPYTSKQLKALQRRLNNVERSMEELREVGCRLFLALCGSETPGTNRLDHVEQSVQAILRSVIQRTLGRRGTVALTFSFDQGCDEFVSYPWELLHNGEHFLLASGVFTLTRALLRPDEPVGCELPVHPPFRLLYISATPHELASLETERSFEALQDAVMALIENNQLYLDRLEPPTFDNLVEYLSLRGGAGVFDETETSIPCYVIHFDGHGAYGRLCPNEDCAQMNDADARKCTRCGEPLGRVKAQTYLCFCTEEGGNCFIGTQSLRDLFLSSDVRLAVFAACETATLLEERLRHQRRRAAVDATLATALVTAQVPAVVAMPFSIQDDLNPIFMKHFYSALAQGRTLEEALSRARHAMLPKQHSWFIPVLYRHVAEGKEEPVELLADQDTPDEHEHLTGQLEATTTFVGREQELLEIDVLLTDAARGRARFASIDARKEEQRGDAKGQFKLRPGTHHIALTGPPGIGKSAIAFEAVRRNRQKFVGGVINISLQGGRSFSDALIDIGHHLRISPQNMHATDLSHRERLVLSKYRSLADREFHCLLLLDGFEEIKEHAELELWYRFLCSLPQEVVVLVTSRSNPGSAAIIAGMPCRWYEYQVGKMPDADLLRLFSELAAESGLGQRIHLDDPAQQAVLREICTLLDGYPLGAQLIFGTASSIKGKVYTPEAATRSLEEVRDELRNTLLPGIWAVLEVAYQRLTPPARLLLSYLAAFKLPFSHEQIILLIAPETHDAPHEAVRLEREHPVHDVPSDKTDMLRSGEDVAPAVLAENWRAARDELVTASFIQFDGRVYRVHSQVRNFALSYLPLGERRRVHRVAAAYYCSLAQPSPDEWFAAFEHLEGAGEPQDLQHAVRLAVDASWALEGRGYAHALLAMLRRAEAHALRLGDKTGEGKIQCCLGAILRLLGKNAEAVGCLTRSLALHREQHEPSEEGWALYELAMLYREEGQFQQAGIYAQEAQNLFRTVGYAKGEAWMQMMLGEVSRGYGNYYEALGHFDRALASFRTLHNDEGSAWTLRDQGTVNEALGRYSRALAQYEEALRLFNVLGIRSGQAWVLAGQSVVYTDQGKLDLAEQACSEAITIFREQGIRRGEGWALSAMGDIVRERHQLNAARSYFEEALSIFAGLGDRVDQARALNALGAITFEEGNYVLAKEDYEHALVIAREQSTRHIEGRALRGLGDIARVMHRFDDADRYYQDAYEIAAQLDTPAERCATLRRQGELRCQQGQYRETLEFWKQALALDQRLEHPARKHLQDKLDALVAEHHLE